MFSKLKQSLTNLTKRWQAVTSWKKTLVFLVAGIIVGLVFQEKATILEPIGVLFLNSVFLLVLPIIFTTIICAVVSFGENKSHGLGHITLKAACFYVFFTMCAAVIGILITNLYAPGVNFVLSKAAEASALSNLPMNAHATTLATMLPTLIPNNIMKAFLDVNILEIIVVAVLFGIAIVKSGDKGKPVAQFMTSLNQVTFKLAGIIMEFAPYGIFALIATTFGNYGFDVLLPLASFIASIWTACLIHMFFVYGAVLLVYRINVVHFFKSVIEAWVMAFTTSSSAATLPVSMRVAHEKLKVPKSLSNFLIPLGSNFNLNGLSIYLSATVIFSANIYGIHLGISDYITMIGTIVVLTMGVAGVPSSGLIVMSAVLTGMHVPLGALGLVAGVDRINDMFQTTTNVIGDIVVAKVIADSDKSAATEVETAIEHDPDALKQVTDLAS